MNSFLPSYLLLITLTLFSCSDSMDQNEEHASGSTESQKEKSSLNQKNESSENQEYQAIDGSKYEQIDLNQSLEGKSLEELRLLRNAVYARQGFLFMRADLRGYFSKYPWYDSLMYARWVEDDALGKSAEINLSVEESDFIARVKAKEEVLIAENFIEKNGYSYANVNNIVNGFQFVNLDKEFLSKLDQNGFAIVPNSNIQLFHLYEQNDYQQVPNFVTTDLFLQLYHMYFSYLLRSLEEGIFYTRMTSLSEALSRQALNDYQNVEIPEQKKSAAFSSVFFHVATKLLNGNTLPLPNELKIIADAELKNITAAKDAPSRFLGYPSVKFPYSLFKPRGHYTRSDSLKNYFKAMMWLQKGEMCMDDKSFDHALYMARLLENTKVGNESALKLFESVYQPIKYIIGDPDNLSVYDLVQDKSWQREDLTEANKDALKKRLLALDRNRIKPKTQLSCLNKINLFPQRYLFDNEILQELVDTESKQTKRGYPKGIDVFGVLGVTEANNLINDFYKEPALWDGYEKKFEKLKTAAAARPRNTVYSKWMECLLSMQQPQSTLPAFMKTPSWDKKELNTALASWAELKHDAILYAEQPMGAECGDGGPPPPVTVGYVEPNLLFWKSMAELVKTTNQTLEKYNLFTKEIKNKSERIEEMVGFLLQASEKEIRGEALSDQEYNTIEIIGSTVEYITISLLPHWVDNWSMVKGPDREVSVVADIYTANSDNNPNKGILHVGVGPVNDIYVVVEIEGLLYLTRGAVFSYYEFVEPLGTRLTDEEWQERIKDKKLPPIPGWMKEIIYDKEAPKSDEAIFYSSGC